MWQHSLLPVINEYYGPLYSPQCGSTFLHLQQSQFTIMFIIPAASLHACNEMKFQQIYPCNSIKLNWTEQGLERICSFNL